ncbi:MAG: hypothetical protein ABSF92_02640 [Candidatus Acidiferrales bacterium]|jgi:hypothetical protein
MSDAPSLKETLISVCEQLKSQHRTIVSLICDAAALRTIVLENSPLAQENYAKLFARQMEETTPSVVAATQLYERLIQQLRSDAPWVN